MGVETDLILATPDQAEAVLASADPAKDFGGVYAKGTDPISLGALQSVLTGEGGSDDFLEDYRDVITEPNGEKSVLEVPAPLREALLSLADDQIPETVEQWMMTEEFMLTGWDVQIAADFLRDIKQLISADGAGEKELWLAISV